MSFTFRPVSRSETPIIVGIAGPTKSGKTMSALRLATGLAGGGAIAVINTEGALGRIYADRFTYIGVDLEAPFSPLRYAEAIEEAKKIKPAVLVIDSGSHAHDGPGGLLDWHEAELDRMAGQDYKKRERCTWTAWIKPKDAENKMIYSLLGLNCPVVLAFRAKERIKIVKGADPVNLGWQPIAGRITFETIFTLILPPNSKGVPDLDASEMREPFDTMVPRGKPVDEALGRALAVWSKGGAAPVATTKPSAAKAVKNAEFADCYFCNGGVEIAEGWTKDGKTIHAKCVDAAKKERDQ